MDPVTADAAGLWTEIHERYDTTDVQSAGRYHSKLWAEKIPEDGNAQEHINKFSRCFNKLTQAGRPIKDVDFATALLLSLPLPQYSTLRTIKLADPNLNSRNAKSRILAEWEQLGFPGRENGDDSGDEETESKKEAKAFFSKPEPKGKGNTNVRRKFCTEHPNANTHDTKECNVLKHREGQKEEKEIEDLRKGLDALKAASARAAVAAVSLGAEDGDGLEGWVSISSTALIVKAIDETAYVIDFGATEHMVCNDKDLHDMVPVQQVIRAGGNNLVKVTHKGTLRVGDFNLENVLYAPSLGFNLLSVHKLGQIGYHLSFKGDRCAITDASGKPVLDVQGDGLYAIKASSLVAQHTSTDALLYLHRSLAHLNWPEVVKLARSGRLGSEWRKLEYSKILNVLCQPCVEGKGHRSPSPVSSIRPVNPNEILHSDFWGPTKHASREGFQYFMTFYDDYTHRIQLYCLKDKKGAVSAFKQYLNLVATQCDTKVKLVRSDNGGEFTSDVFLKLLAAEGIVPHRIPPDAHAQKGRVERVHRTILDAVRTILADTKLPKPWWADMASYVAYARNRIPRADTGRAPHEMWTSRPCTQTQLRPFGSVVYIKDHKETDKLAPRMLRAMLIGYQAYSETIIRY
jgi:hypothetical protein